MKTQKYITMSHGILLKAESPIICRIPNAPKWIQKLGLFTNRSPIEGYFNCTEPRTGAKANAVLADSRKEAIKLAIERLKNAGRKKVAQRIKKTKKI